MEDKELEKLLQEKADNIKMRDFSEVWNEIKDEIKEPIKEKKFRWKKWLPMIMASAVLVVCLALSPVIIKALKPAPNLPPEEVYFTEELSKTKVPFEDAFNGLAQANISHVDMSEYSFMDTFLYYTEDMKVKGAYLSLYSSTFFAEINFYDKSVDLNLDLDTLYDKSCKINSTDVLYKFKQENGGAYDYSIFAVHNNVQYVIEYTGVSDNLVDFLNEFFG